jgi:hypothetical protein
MSALPLKADIQTPNKMSAKCQKRTYLTELHAREIVVLAGLFRLGHGFIDGMYETLGDDRLCQKGGV